jgi:hypothetical protein
VRKEEEFENENCKRLWESEKRGSVRMMKKEESENKKERYSVRKSSERKDIKKLV